MVWPWDWIAGLFRGGPRVPRRPTVPCGACNGKGFYFQGGRAVQCGVCKGKKRVHTYGEPEID
jgi:hypothetical protein